MVILQMACVNFVECDAYFDKGYISLNDNLVVILSTQVEHLDNALKKRLKALEGRRIASPIYWNINLEFIEIHRGTVLI